MKCLILTFYLLLSLTVFSQNDSCSSYIITNYDEMTGKTHISSKPIMISDDGGKTGFVITLLMSSQKEDIIFSVVSVGGGNCISENNRFNFLFTDGTRLELNSNSEFNCKGKSIIYFGGVFGRDEDLKQLVLKEVKAMRISTYDSALQKPLTSANSMQLNGSLACMYSMMLNK